MDKAIAERKGHNTSMDIYLVQNPPGPYHLSPYAFNLNTPVVVPMEAIQAQLIKQETSTRTAKKGVAAWVGEAIAVEIAQ